MNRNEVLKMLVEVKKECGNNPSCNTCLFYNDAIGVNCCLIVDSECPDEWIVEEPINE